MRLLLAGLVVLVLALLALGLAVWWYGPEQLDRRLNRVVADPDAPVPDEADRTFHRSLFIADLHADTLKWERDLLERASFGHVDLPRLVEGNVGLQVFTIVTKSPVVWARIGIPGALCVDAGSLNLAAVLAFFQGRPAFSLRERMFHQVRRLKGAVERSKERDGTELRLITDFAGLEGLVRDRAAGFDVIGAILGIEGAHWLGDPEQGSDSVDQDMRELFDLGIRVFSLTHRFDNLLAGSSEGCDQYGLTEFGRRAVELAEEFGIAVDLSHLSSAGIRELIEMARRPVIVSHTGLQHGCEDPCRPERNLSNHEIRLILENRGLIGIGYWPEAVGPSAWRIADAIEHVIRVAGQMGIEGSRHVALGSDYDGSVKPFFDASQIDVLTTIMRRRDQPFDAATIRNIAGLNACRYFGRILPGGSEAAADELCALLRP
ncbi:MAG: membrane dipeptidase [Geminicoccaceae bacterium]|nr:membrane dipeptidase [Geminicoccaceae bacterium]